MFNNITNLAQTRTITGAVGFFLFYTVLLVGLSTFLGHYMVSMGLLDSGIGSFFDGGEAHAMIGAGWVLILSSMILHGRKMTGDLLSVAISLIGVYLAYTVDVMLGMVVVAYLTTLGK